MAPAARFEDLVAWQKARILVRAIYQQTSAGALNRDYGFCSQVRRAAVSVMNNIAEGFGRRGDKEFASFLRIARASCSEVQSMLYVAIDIDYIDKGQFDDLYSKCSEAASVINGLLAYVSKPTPS